MNTGPIFNIAFKRHRGIKPRNVRFRLLHFWVTFAMVISVLGPESTPGIVLAQEQRIRRAPARQNAKVDRRAQRGRAVKRTLIETDASILNLLRQADDGVVRGDWKLAIDSLQRIIDDPKGSLVARSNGDDTTAVLYESARQHAIRQLASMPEEGIAAYRTLFDGKAKGIFHRSLQSHDKVGLQLLVDRYLLTQYGDDAADMLASWELDSGRPLEAVTVLERLTEMVPDFDIPARRIVGKLAAAYAILGRSYDVDRVLNQAAEGEFPEVPLNWLRTIVSSVSDHREYEDVIPSHRKWSMVAGSLDRRNVMPGVDPNIETKTPWRYEMPDMFPGSVGRTYVNRPGGELLLPTLQLLSSDGKLFARTLGGVLAVDADSFAPQWQTPLPSVIRAARLSQFATGSASSRLMFLSPDATVEDYVAGDMSTSHGLVFTIERHVLGLGEGLQVSPSNGVRRRGRRLGPARPLSRLVAYDAETGEIKWHKGGTRNLTARLAGAEFRAAPISVEGVLWVPYYKHNDFHLGVLEPATGRVLDEILLCSLTSTPSGPKESLLPAYASGVVYVPSGEGVLFAVNVSDHSLRWAHRYTRSSQSEPVVLANCGSRWLPSPPVVAGGVVLLAAGDNDKLMAFDTSTGKSRWATCVADGSYVLAANDNRVWVGGQFISCMNIVNGEPYWKSDQSGTPTGKAVLSGDRVLMPTNEGLVAFDSASGVLLDKQTLTDRAWPFGNILCMNSALYLLEGRTVSKFPDVAQMYASTVARVESDNVTARDTVRLATLELLRENPSRALALLDTLSSDDLNRRTSIYASARSARMEALLALGKQSNNGRADTLQLFDRAIEVALTATDRIRCKIAKSRQLQEYGQTADACALLSEAGLSSDSDETIRLEPLVFGPARSQVVEGLTGCLSKLTSVERTQFQKVWSDYTNSRIDELGEPENAKRAARRLRVVADLPLAIDLQQRALLALGKWNRGRGRFEIAEQQLLECVDVNGTTDDALDALLILTEIYQRPPGQSASALLYVLDRLDRDFENHPIPSDGENERLGRDRFEDKTLIGRWTEKVRASLTSADFDRYRAPPVLAKTLLEDEQKPTWTHSLNAGKRAPGLVNIASSRPSLLADHVYVKETVNSIACFDRQSGEDRWRVDFQLPEMFSPSQAGNNSLGTHAAVADSQIGVFAGHDGLFAIGLMTGKRLWAKPFVPQMVEETNPYPDTAMAAGDGQFVALPTRGKLTMMRLADGQMLWERKLRGEHLEHLWLEGAHVVAANKSMDRVHLYERKTGHLVRQILLRQPQPDNWLVNLVRAEGMLCGPKCTPKADAVVGVDLATGDTKWEVQLDKPLVQLFVPAPGYLAIGMLAGDVKVVAISTGEEILDVQLPGQGMPVYGRMVAGTMIVQRIVQRGAKRYPSLMAADIATGEVLWERNDLAPFTGNEEAFEVIGNHLFVVTEREVSSKAIHGRRARVSMRLDAVMIDAATGNNVGKVLELPFLNIQEELQYSGDFRGQIMLVRTNRALHALRMRYQSDMSLRGS